MRLDIDRQKELEPKRMEYARNQITALGYEITEENATTLKFTFKDRQLRYSRIPVGIPGKPYRTDGVLGNY